MLRISYARTAQKFLKNCPGKHCSQIVRKIEQLRTNPFPHDSIQMKGKAHEYRRVDIGEYRVIYRVEGQDLLITMVGRRNDDAIYREFERARKN